MKKEERFRHLSPSAPPMRVLAIVLATLLSIVHVDSLHHHILRYSGLHMCSNGAKLRIDLIDSFSRHRRS